MFRAFVISTCLVLLLGACSSSTVFEEELSIEEGIWSNEQKAVFDFEIQNTDDYYDLYIYLRNTEDYAYSNIYLFTTMYFPNGKAAVDTIECTLADPSGNWYGSGFSGVYENRIRFSENKAFPLTGDYRFEINQAMRDDELSGITDVGFGIDKHE